MRGGNASLATRGQPISQDMWQRYNDCVICDCKSIPNVQGLVIDASNRNMLVAFNKVLHIWRYEKTEAVMKDCIDETYNNSNSWLANSQKALGIEKANM
jgi:hypothetical protein